MSDAGARRPTSAWVIVASALVGSVIGGLLVLWGTGQLSGRSSAPVAVAPPARPAGTTPPPAPRAPALPEIARDEGGARRVVEAGAPSTVGAPTATAEGHGAPGSDGPRVAGPGDASPARQTSPAEEPSAGPSVAGPLAAGAPDGGGGSSADDGSDAPGEAAMREDGGAEVALPDVAAAPPAPSASSVPPGSTSAPAEPAPPPRVPLPVRDAPTVLDAALADRTPAGVAWSVRLLAPDDRTIEHAEIAHAEIDGRLQTLAMIDGDGPRRAARLLDRSHAPGGESVRVFYPEERVVRPAAVDDPFAGTGFRYDDFLALRAADFEPIRLEGDQLAGQPIFVVTARPLDAPALDHVEMWIRERDMRLLEWRAHEPGRQTPVRRVVVSRPEGADADGAQVWRVYGPGDRLVARAVIDATPLPADLAAETFTFSRMGEPGFTVLAR